MPKRITEIQLTEEQELALNHILSGENVFLTGSAGSGKSFTIKTFIEQVNRKDYPVLASTGAAAVLVGGRTFHSFFGLGIMDGGLDAVVDRALSNKKISKRLQKIKGVVIDEISMLDAPTLRAAEMISRCARDSQQPWGGLQIIAVGDFAQLPPVQNGYDSEKRWAFLDALWDETDFTTIYLSQNLRCSEPDFMSVLNEIRLGRSTSSVESFLNSRVVEELTEDFEGTRLFPRRKPSEQFNEKKLSQLDEELRVFSTVYEGSKRHVDKLKKASPLPEQLKLKKHCLVMLRMNDPRGRWVNGSQGRVLDFFDDHILVELKSGRIVEVKEVTLSWLDADGAPVATLTNYPLQLAYATTIHKSQGMTLDEFIVDLKNLWEPGQAYVAVSRARDPESLYLSGWTRDSIKADKKVIDFYEPYLIS